jgi:endoglucanase
MNFLAAFSGAVLFFMSGVASANADMVRVVDVTMAAPDIVAIEIRDPSFGRGGIVALDAPRSEAVGSWVELDGQWGLVIGPDRRHLRLSDTPPSRYLDRDTVDDATHYRLNGQARIRSVHRKSMPYDSGIYRGPDGGARTGASMRHQVFLKLDRPLEPGTHSLSWPRGLFPALDFEFDPKTTRALALRASQIGQTPTDVSRKAYLSLWLPSGEQEGAVDFRTYGIDDFAILDDAGRQVFEAPIRLRFSPQDPEPGNGLSTPLLDRARADGERLSIERVEQGEEIRAIVPGHAYKTGERVLFERLGGDQDAGAVMATVADATAEGFTLVDVQGQLPAEIADGATVVAAHRTNRAGTFVFELDYSAWKPERIGAYRLHIAGLGVSDAFEISDNAWLDVSRTMIGGLYNHRSGVELDGRFGYSRPAAFRPVPDLVIRESRLPLAWSSEAPDGGFVPFAEAAKPGFLGDGTMPDSYWGGYMDAGDWDRRIQHLDIANLMLTLLETGSAEGALPERLGLPASSIALEDARFAEADDLPDILQESLWGVEFYRRLQLADGSVRGGVESDEHPLLGSASYLEHRQVFAYAPDPMSTYIYAATAGRLARVLRQFGKASLADLYSASAHAAWGAAEKGYANPDLAYADAIVAGEAAGLFSEVPWQARKTLLQEKTGTYRVATAAALFRLDAQTVHRQIAEQALSGDWNLYMHKGDAAWDYIRSAGSDPALRQKMEQLILDEVQLVVSAQSSSAYPSMKHPYTPAGWGQGGPPDYSQTQSFIRAHYLSGNPAILGLMEDTLRGLVGANQTGLSLITGLGARPIMHPLHEDHRAMGVDAPPGIAIFGWTPQEVSAYGWIFGPPWSPLAEVGTNEDAQARRLSPARWSLPAFEYLVEHPGLIVQQEYTVQQTIAPVAAVALYLHAARTGKVRPPL